MESPIEREIFIDTFLEGLHRRHSSTQHMIAQLKPNPNLNSPQFDIADDIWNVAVNITEAVNDGPELTAGLRKLLEAKDCLVRASLDLKPSLRDWMLSSGDS